ncbi:MAG: phosphoenolpyruvate carboxykinase [Planctomycetota bacterium]|jgi:phosphoenolpyruvate carboxykinase (ATP)
MDLSLPTAELQHLKDTHWNLSVPELYEEIVRRGEGRVAHQGPVVMTTGEYTGRSPRDKYIVLDGETEDRVWWDGGEAHKFTTAQFDRLFARQQAYLQGRDVFIQDCYAGADQNHKVAVRVVTQNAWHALFAQNMFIPETDEAKLADFAPDFTVVHTPGLLADPEIDGTRSEVFIVLNFERRMILIGGSKYAGEIKKSIFTTLNYLLPLKGVLGMHCSANVGPDGDSALFFGLSGTGKTTLSADKRRSLIGDDEHGWSEEGIFNFEGGCYAKVIRLSQEAEPEIYEQTRSFGTILENVAFVDGTRHLNLDDATFTENTRASYPLSSVQNVVENGRAGHPKNVVFLTCDAFGVLPPISRLTPEQAMYHFISGYTAKVAGTERGVTEPTAAFSACFGAPFMPLHPAEYAKLLGKQMLEHGSTCWLVNTGWSGGPYGTGSRMPIQHSRALLHAALEGKLADVEYRKDTTFGFAVPTSCAGVPDEVLDPRATWADGSAYDEKAVALAEMFQRNFERFSEGTAEEVRAAGPRVAQVS